MGTIRKHAIGAIVALVLLGARGVMAAPFVWIGSGFPTWPTLNLTLSSSTNQLVVGTPLQVLLTSNLTGTFTVQATPGVCSTDTGGVTVFPSGNGGTNVFNVIGLAAGACSITISNGSVQVVQGTFIVSGASAGLASGVPTLDTYALIFLVAAMGVAGLASLRHPARVE